MPTSIRQAFASGLPGRLDDRGRRAGNLTDGTHGLLVPRRSARAGRSDRQAPSSR
jgi:hypothetical protein